MNTAIVPKNIRKLFENGFEKNLSSEILVKLSKSASQVNDIPKAVHIVAQCAIEERNYENAFSLYLTLLNYLKNKLGQKAVDRKYIDTVFLLSDLFKFIRMLSASDMLMPFMELACQAAKRIDDKRALAVLYLNYGYFCILSRFNDKAIELFDKGSDLVEELGDPDINFRCDFFRGWFSLFQGKLKESIAFFERMMLREDKASGYSTLKKVAIPLGCSYALMGKYPQAIGVLNSSLKAVMQNGDDYSSSFYRAQLCWILLLSGRKSEAISHLPYIIKEPQELEDKAAFIIGKRANALYFLMEGRFNEADQELKECATFSPALSRRYFGMPWILEMLFILEKKGFKPIPGLELKKELEEAINEPSLLLRGTALRIKAQLAADAEEKPDVIWSLLTESEKELETAGSPIELVKTWTEMAKVKKRNGDKRESRNLAMKAWANAFSANVPFFPPDLHELVGVEISNETASIVEMNSGSRFFEMLDELQPGRDHDEFLYFMLAAVTRFFRAESGGLFCPNDKSKSSLTLLKGFNIDVNEIKDKSFTNKMKHIKEVYRIQKPMLFNVQQGASEEENTNRMKILCMPLKIKKVSRWILFLNNIHGNLFIETYSEGMLKKFSESMEIYANRMLGYHDRLKEIIEDTRLAINRTTISKNLKSDFPIAHREAMRSLMRKAERVASSDATILISGETGTGKEVLAREIHAMSDRSKMPFVAVNITSLPGSLLESELLGHEKGAFTGADKMKQGLIELANRGTLFLDEIGEIPMSIQAKLLRIIEEKTLFRVGGILQKKVDFRLIAATNRDLVSEVENGKFREDLYYRLNIIPLTLPPLRERGDEIIQLARYFLSVFSQKYRLPLQKLTPKVEDELLTYHWPGNVRELKNIIEQAVLLSEKGSLEIMIPRRPKMAFEPNLEQSLSFMDKPTMDDLQRRYLRFIMSETNGKIGGSGGAAEVLGMKRTSLYKRMQKLGVTNK